MTPTVAYLINQYPKVSHSFIRREIIGVEACGVRVLRFAIRSCEAELVDEADKQELKKTRIVLSVGIVGLLLHLSRVLLTRPIQFWKALLLACKIGLRSEPGLILHLAYLAEACVLLNWISASHVTHIHAHFGTNSTTVAMLCHALGGPAYSFTVHGPEEFDRVREIGLTEKLERAAFVIAVSSFGKSQLCRWSAREQWSKYWVVHCGVDQEFLNQPIVPIPQEPRLVCVGRLSEQKGHLLLLEAVKQLALEGLEFKLILVGDGSLRSEIDQLAVQWNLQNFIEITGWASTTDVRRYILSSRALVLPSFAEGLPVVIMESLALGRPVISTYVAGIPELVDPEVCGWLVPAGSVEELAIAMREALNLPVEIIEKMGRIGSERVALQHNAELEASKLANLFQFNMKQLSENEIAKLHSPI